MGGSSPRCFIRISTTTMSPVVCLGGGSAGNNRRTSVLLLTFLRVPSGSCSRLTKKRTTYRVGNKKPEQSARAGDGDLNHCICMCFCTPKEGSKAYTTCGNILKKHRLLHSFGGNSASQQIGGESSGLMSRS